MYEIEQTSIIIHDGIYSHNFSYNHKTTSNFSFNIKLLYHAEK